VTAGCVLQTMALPLICMAPRRGAVSDARGAVRGGGFAVTFARGRT